MQKEIILEDKMKALVDICLDLYGNDISLSFYRKNMLRLKYKTYDLLVKLVTDKSNFYTEINTYEKLPYWWPIQLIEYNEIDKVGCFMILSFFEHKPWLSIHKNNNYLHDLIQAQITCLDDQQCKHNNLNIKNILLSKDEKSLVIIGFDQITELQYQETNQLNFNIIFST